MIPHAGVVGATFQACTIGSIATSFGRPETASPLHHPTTETASAAQWSKGYFIESVSQRSLIRVRQYLREQLVNHPNEAIPGWTGDTPEFEPAGQDDMQFPKSVY